MFEVHYFEANGQRLHCMVDGPTDAPVMLMLHGFPENWRAWAEVGKHFTGRFRVVLPDQRGFNLSSKPEEAEAYHTKHLAADMLALLDRISPHQPVVLCGHDWGASVAYALAMRHSDRFSHLIIANGVHPICFQKALYANGPQRAASQYMSVLRGTGMEEHMAANGFSKLFRMFEKFSTAPWLNDEKREEFKQAWAQPGSMAAMLNWYRGSPMVVPPVDAPTQALDITKELRAKFAIPLPHLLLWGEKDTALLEEARADIHAFCDDVTFHAHPEASHWILHEQPQWAVEKMEAFLD